MLKFEKVFLDRRHWIITKNKIANLLTVFLAFNLTTQSAEAIEQSNESPRTSLASKSADLDKEIEHLAAIKREFKTAENRNLCTTYAHSEVDAFYLAIKELSELPTVNYTRALIEYLQQKNFEENHRHRCGNFIEVIQQARFYLMRNKNASSIKGFKEALRKSKEVLDADKQKIADDETISDTGTKELRASVIEYPSWSGTITLNAPLAPTEMTPVLGVGFDTVSNRVRGQCLAKLSPFGEKFQELRLSELKPSDQIPKNLELSILKHDNYESLVRSLSIGGSISVAASFGSGGVEAKYIQDFSASKHAIFVEALANITLEQQSGAPREFSEDWKQGFESANWSTRFNQMCGDAYVSSLQRGGKLRVIYKLDARDEEEKRILNLAFKGSSLSGSFSTKGAFSEAITKIGRFQTVDYHLFISGGNIPEKIPSDVDGVLEMVLRYPASVQFSNAALMGFSTLDYSTIYGFPSIEGPLKTHQRAFLKIADDDYSKVSARRSQLVHIKKNPNIYEKDHFDENYIQELDKKLIRAAYEIAKAANDCYQDASACDANYPSVNLDRDFKLPAALPRTYYRGGCKRHGDRFGNANGGCLDASTLSVWSAPSTILLDFSGAREYCSSLTENGVSGWRLPKLTELISLDRNSGIESALTEGFLLNDFFWAVLSSIDSRGVRVSPLNGFLDSKADQQLKFRAVCVQG